MPGDDECGRETVDPDEALGAGDGDRLEFGNLFSKPLPGAKGSVTALGRERGRPGAM